MTLVFMVRREGGWELLEIWVWGRFFGILKGLVWERFEEALRSRFGIVGLVAVTSWYPKPGRFFLAKEGLDVPSSVAGPRD